VYVWAQPDERGDRLVAAARQALPDANVILPPDDRGSLSEAHRRGEDLSALVETLKERALPITRADASGRLKPHLSDLRPEIAAIRESGGSSQQRRQAIAELVAGWFRDQDRLVTDVGQDPGRGGRPYLVADDGALWAIEPKGMRTRLALCDSGLRRTDREYQSVVEELLLVALQEGQHVRLARWQHRGDGALYVSCGPSHLVRSDGKTLEKLPNGIDGVWFPGDAAYPEWEPTTPVAPEKLAVFRPCLEAPEGVPTYTPEVQRLLLQVWIAGIFSDLRPLMCLLLFGKKGGGKTTTMAAILRMLMGPEARPTVLSDDRKDFWTLLTSSSLEGLDNLDQGGPSWFPDLLCAAITGFTPALRKLYTDLERIERPVTAAVAISTRTARFCRDDVAERCLPLTTGEFAHADRIADADLLEEVDAHRDGLLSWGVLTAARLLVPRRDAPPGLPQRFVDFGRLVWAYLAQQEREEEAASMLTALESVQVLVVQHVPPLIRAILEHWDAIAPDDSWKGNAKELADALRRQGAILPRTARDIPSQLRRSRSILERQGFLLDICSDRGRHVTITLLRG